MDETEGKILFYLELGYKMERIIEEFNIDEEMLADIMIELDSKNLAVLRGKEWILTEKGQDILKELKTSLKKLKIDYLHGDISKEEFYQKRKELDYILILEKSTNDGQYEKTTEYKKNEKEKINCPKCKKENKAGSKFCSKCGEPI